MDSESEPKPYSDRSSAEVSSDDDVGGFVEEPTIAPNARGSSLSSAPVASSQTDTNDDGDLDPPTLHRVDDDAAGLPDTVDPLAESCRDQPTLPRDFGDYELIEEIARGGMGVVYRARQRQLNRFVAIKMILAGQLAHNEDVARFYAEAEAAASLDHPGIVPIYEVGCHRGQHFFSMGYVEGPSLGQMILDRPLDAKVAAELCRQVSVAVGYAHGRNVIHRDLKPANVLVARNESMPADSSVAGISFASHSITRGASGQGSSVIDCGVAKVTDFGLAKNVEQQSELTATGQILGTPGYMPPEQAAGNIDEVGAGADIYSIGGILYALLTGRAPFQAATPLDTLMQVLEREPVAPRQLNAGVPSDLETICLKCLQKDPKRRYESASALTDDLVRFLDGEPIEARPVSRMERGWRWARRHPAVAALSATTLALLAIIVTIAPLVAVQQSQLRVAEKAARIEAVEVSEELADANDDAEANLYAARVKLAYQHFLDGSMPQMRRTLNEAPTAYRSWEWDFVSGLQKARRVVLRGHPGEVAQVRFRPADAADAARGDAGGISDVAPQLVTVGKRLNAQLWDAQNGLPGRRFQAATANVLMDRSGTRSVNFIEDTVLIVDHLTERPTLRFSTAGAPVLATAISSDGGRVAVLRESAEDESSLKIRDANTGDTLGGPWAMPRVSEPQLIFDPDGDRLVLADLDVASSDSTQLLIWLEGSHRGWRLASHQGGSIPTALAWADTLDDENFLLVGDGQGEVQVHRVDASRGDPLPPTGTIPTTVTASIPEAMTVLSGSGAGIVAIAFDPRSKRLSVACEDRRVAVWDNFAPTSRSLLCGLIDLPTGLAIDPGGRYLAAGSQFGATVWKLPPPGALPIRQETERVSVSLRPLVDMAVAPDGNAFIVDRAGQIRRMDIATGRLLDSDLQRWLSGELKIPSLPIPPDRDPKIPAQMAISPDGRILALSVARMEVTDANRSQRIRSSVVLWDLRTRRPVGVLGEHSNVITGMAFSPTGDRIATVSGIPEITQRAIARADRMGNTIGIDDNDVRVWDIASGQTMAVSRERAAAYTAVHWMPDDSGITVAIGDGNLENLDVTDLGLISKIVAPISLQVADIVAVPASRSSDTNRSGSSSPADLLVAVAFNDGQIRLYDKATGVLKRSLVGHADAVTTLHYDPDLGRLFSGSLDASVRVWEAERGLEVLKLPHDGASVSRVMLSPAGHLLTIAEDGAARLWRIDRSSSTDLAAKMAVGDARSAPDSTRWQSLGRIDKRDGDDLARVWDRDEAWDAQVGEWEFEPGRLIGTTAPAGGRPGGRELALGRVRLKALSLPDTQELTLAVRVDSGMGLQIHFRGLDGQQGETIELLSGLNPFSQRQGVLAYAMSDIVTAREITANSSISLVPGQLHRVCVRRMPGELIVEIDGELALVSPQATVPESSLILQPMYGDVGGRIVIEDLEIAGPVDAIQRRDVAMEVDRLMDRWLIKERVDREISNRRDWSIELKRFARQRLAGLSIDADQIDQRIEAFFAARESTDDASEVRDDPRWILALSRYRAGQDESVENLKTLARVLAANGDPSEAADIARQAARRERDQSGAVSIPTLRFVAGCLSGAGDRSAAEAVTERADRLARLDRAAMIDAGSSDLDSDAAPDDLAAITQASLARWLAVWRGGPGDLLDDVVDEAFTASWAVAGAAEFGYTVSLDQLRRRLDFERQGGRADVDRTIYVEDYEVAKRGGVGGVRATVAIQNKAGFRRCQWDFRLRRQDERWRLVSATDRLLAKREMDRVETWNTDAVDRRRSRLATLTRSVSEVEGGKVTEPMAILREKIETALSLRELNLAEGWFETVLSRPDCTADDWVAYGITQMQRGLVEDAEQSVLRAIERDASLDRPGFLVAIKRANSGGATRQAIGSGLSAEIPDGWRRASREMFLAPGEFLSGWFLRGNTAMLALRIPQKQTPKAIREQIQQLAEGGNRDVLEMRDRRVGDFAVLEIEMEGAGTGGMIDGRGNVWTHQFNHFLFRDQDIILLSVVCPADDWDEISADVAAVTDSLRYDPPSQ